MVFGLTNVLWLGPEGLRPLDGSNINTEIDIGTYTSPSSYLYQLAPIHAPAFEVDWAQEG